MKEGRKGRKEKGLAAGGKSVIIGQRRLHRKKMRKEKEKKKKGKKETSRRERKRPLRFPHGMGKLWKKPSGSLVLRRH